MGANGVTGPEQGFGPLRGIPEGGVSQDEVDHMELFPEIPLGAWADSKATVHRFAQIVGKVRLSASVRRNHWWNVPFHLTGRGITTRPMGGLDDNPVFAIDFD